MASMSNFFENVFVDLIFRGRTQTINGKTLSWSAAPTFYVGLLTTAPSDAGGGTEVSTSGTNYGRVAILSDYTKWESTQQTALDEASTGTSGTTRNVAIIQFLTPSANWGQVSHIGLYDAATAGSLLFWSALPAPKNINDGDAAPYYPASTFTVQVDN